MAIGACVLLGNGASALPFEIAGFAGEISDRARDAVLAGRDGRVRFNVILFSEVPHDTPEEQDAFNAAFDGGLLSFFQGQGFRIQGFRFGAEGIGGENSDPNSIPELRSSFSFGFAHGQAALFAAEQESLLIAPPFGRQRLLPAAFISARINDDGALGPLQLTLTGLEEALRGLSGLDLDREAVTGLVIATFEATPVPEPGTALVMGSSLLGCAIRRRWWSSSVSRPTDELADGGR